MERGRQPGVARVKKRHGEAQRCDEARPFSFIRHLLMNKRQNKTMNMRSTSTCEARHARNNKKNAHSATKTAAERLFGTAQAHKSSHFLPWTTQKLPLDRPQHTEPPNRSCTARQQKSHPDKAVGGPKRIPAGLFFDTEHVHFIWITTSKFDDPLTDEKRVPAVNERIISLPERAFLQQDASINKSQKIDVRAGSFAFRGIF